LNARCSHCPATDSLYILLQELIAGDYDAKADVWSIGVLAFMLLSSSMPFYGNNRQQVVKKISKGQYKMAGRRWRDVSQEAVDFVWSLLQVDPTKRPSAEEALLLPWLKRKSAEAQGISDMDMMDKIAASIQAFTSYGTLKKLGLMVVAYKSTSSEVGFLKRMFVRFDSLQNGEISKEEFAEAMAAYDYCSEEVGEIDRFSLDSAMRRCDLLFLTLGNHSDRTHVPRYRY
jgi:calcium-dependent protein kinase